MRRNLVVLTAVLACQYGPALAQGDSPARKPDAARTRDASPQARPAGTRPAPTVPPAQAEKPVTPASDYYPYDRRTGGM